MGTASPCPLQSCECQRVLAVGMCIRTLNTITVGMLRMPYSVATPGLSSVFSFNCAQMTVVGLYGRGMPTNIMSRLCTRVYRHKLAKLGLA